MIKDGQLISMTESEWAEFQEQTLAPYRPRTVREFNAIVDLAAARLDAEFQITGNFAASISSIAVEGIKFDAEGNTKFPISEGDMAYVREHGVFPKKQTCETMPSPGQLTRVK